MYPLQNGETEMEEIKIYTAGDSSVLIQFGQEIAPEINAKITAFVHLMRA